MSQYQTSVNYKESLSEFDDSDSFTGSDISEYSDDAEPPWQEEVSKNGELFYVEEETDDAKMSRNNAPVQNENRKHPADHNLHGSYPEVGMEAPRRNGRFRPIAAQEQSQSKWRISNAHTGRDHDGTSHDEISNKDAYREYRRQVEGKVSGSGDNNSFEVYSEKMVSDLKNIFVVVRAASSYGRKGSSSLLATMLGFVSLNNRNGGQHIQKLSHRDQVIVSAILPNGPVSKSEAIDLGDILLAINDVAVYQSNIEQVLGRVPHEMELKLTFQCQNLGSYSDTDSYLEDGSDLTDQHCKPSLVQLLKPATMESAVTLLSQYHAVFYMTLNVNSETARGEEDVLYSYPSSDNPSTRKLKSVRGIFTTLADVSKDAFKSKVLSSTLFVDEELVHCAYCHQGSEVLVMCVPASSYPLTRVHKIMASTVRLLNVMHGSLTKAFQSENSSRLNHLFYLLFNANTLASNEPDVANRPIIGTRSFYLDEDLSVDVDSALAELEAADFDDGFHNQGMTRRLYSILGSCMFYKGYLIANHLPDEDLKDVTLFCQSYCLLGKLRVGQLVIWREVFPSRRKLPTEKTAYRETHGKYFYLIIGLRYSLLCVLLEAGGCSAPVAGKLGPDPLYVNRARATILHLESIDVISGIEEQLCRPAVPTLSSVDSLVQKPPSSLFSSSTHNKPPSGSGQVTTPAARSQGSVRLPFFSSSKKPGSEGSMGSQPTNTGDKTASSPNLMRRIGSQKSLGSQGSADSAGSATKGMKTSSSAISLGDLRGALPSGNKPEATRLTAGTNNTLFHYLHMNIKSGVLMTPSEQDVATLDGPFHRRVIENFYQCVLVLHERLAIAEAKNPGNSNYEEGVLFHCQLTSILQEGNKKGTPFSQYWVIGRSWKGQKFFVCFHDSAQQDMVELAFRMGFGLVL